MLDEEVQVRILWNMVARTREVFVQPGADADFLAFVGGLYADAYRRDELSWSRLRFAVIMEVRS